MSRKGFVVRIGAVFLSIFLLIFQYLDQFHLFLFKFHKNLQVNSSVLPMTLIDNSNAMYVSKLEQHDRRLIDYIRNYVMERPSEVPYSLKDPNKVHFSQANQSQFVAHFFKQKRNGIFFEAGAYDGESLSNSLYFEKSLDWRGILVEPITANQKALRLKHRRSHFFPVCLAGKYPCQVRFRCGATGSGCAVESHLNQNAEYNITRDSWCYPLYSILIAANMTQVDYLVLDLEGFEMEVLSAVPFDQLEIKFIQIEAAIPGSATIDPKLSAALRNFFTTKWPQYKEIDFTNGSDIDVAFINEKLQL